MPHKLASWHDQNVSGSAVTVSSLLSVEQEARDCSIAPARAQAVHTHPPSRISNPNYAFLSEPLVADSQDERIYPKDYYEKMLPLPVYTFTVGFFRGHTLDSVPVWYRAALSKGADNELVFRDPALRQRLEWMGYTVEPTPATFRKEPPRILDVEVIRRINERARTMQIPNHAPIPTNNGLFAGSAAHPPPSSSCVRDNGTETLRWHQTEPSLPQRSTIRDKDSFCMPPSPPPMHRDTPVVFLGSTESLYLAEEGPRAKRGVQSYAYTRLDADQKLRLSRSIGP